MKTCIRCEESQPESSFNRDAVREDGLCVYCRRCVREKYVEKHGGSAVRVNKTADIRAYGRAYRKANLERVREQDREKYARRMRAIHGEDWAPRPKLTADESRARRTLRTKEKRKRQPEKWSARHAVECAVARGRMIPLPCFVCDGKGEGHHPDYAKRMEVVWICHAHHIEVHRLLRNPLDLEL